MKRKIILPILILLILCGGVVYYKAVTRPTPIVLTGIVTTNDVVASSQIQGQLAQVLVKEGDTVKPGQLLAIIEPQELRADASYYLHSERGTAAQVTEAEAALKYQEAQTRDQIKQAEASLAAAQAQEEEAKADLELDRLNYQRTKGLYDQKIDSQQTLDQARATYDAQQAHVESLRKQVEVPACRRSPRPVQRRSNYRAAKPTASHGAAKGRGGRADVESPGSPGLHGDSRLHSGRHFRAGRPAG